MEQDQTSLTAKILNATVIVSALGSLVDMYDFFIFNVTRVASLTDLHLTGDALTNAGLFINNCQLCGILIGSYLWGVLGDKFGRKSCLFASILTYSAATLFCGMVQSVDAYTAGRFVAGLGVAGEIGIGLTLISEKLSADRRGYGGAIFITLGFVGVLIAASAAQYLSWRHAYLAGGVAGLLLLLARILVFESGMYAAMAERTPNRGGLKIIFSNRLMLKKYIAAILILSSCTFLPQIVWTFSPELAKAQGVTEPVTAGVTLALGFACGAASGMLISVLGEKIRSRKKAILAFFIIGVSIFLKYLFWAPASREEFYITNALLGIMFGTWVTCASLMTEQFGTNIRATIATTSPNFARALVIPMNLLFAQLKPLYGSQAAVGIVGFIVFALAFWGWCNVDETYGKDINYIES